MRTLEILDLPDEALRDHLYEVYMTRRHGYVQLFHDVFPLFDALSGRVRIGLLTNGNTDPDRSGLPGRFEFKIYADDYPFRKPDIRLFQAAISATACRADELLHVGDSLESDVHGANEAGVRSAWLNRDGTANRTSVLPDWEIEMLAQLPALLE